MTLSQPISEFGLVPDGSANFIFLNGPSFAASSPLAAALWREYAKDVDPLARGCAIPSSDDESEKEWLASYYAANDLPHEVLQLLLEGRKTRPQGLHDSRGLDWNEISRVAELDKAGQEAWFASMKDWIAGIGASWCN